MGGVCANQFGRLDNNNKQDRTSSVLIDRGWTACACVLRLCSE